MKLQRLALVVAGAGLLAATAGAGPALANSQSDPKPASTGKAANAVKAAEKASTAAAGPCVQTVTWPTGDNFVEKFEVTAGKPPRVSEYAPFNFGTSRYMATWYEATNATGTQNFAYGVYLDGGNLMRHTTVFDQDGGVQVTKTKVGAGWAAFKSISTSNYNVAAPKHSYLYGLNTDGKLYRYAQNGTAYKNLGNFGGFASFKAMTVISEAPTYDTLLMTTKGGALYTIHIPTTAVAKPVVKLIRASGWSAYESLATESCWPRGGSGTLVIGVDHDTDSGFQYAFSKAKGTATVITSYGKVPTAFDGTNHAAYTWYKTHLTGE
ncbi:hypothetical protein [Kribbella sp. NPDC051718]|uniref:hypothetical protein n=1 Tax=Kribbella sp. NPDC051718 TaxID=3155168 RepID=UPI00342F012A